mgnify:CR=1 FL=1
MKFEPIKAFVSTGGHRLLLAESDKEGESLFEARFTLANIRVGDEFEINVGSKLLYTDGSYVKGISKNEILHGELVIGGIFKGSAVEYNPNKVSFDWKRVYSYDLVDYEDGSYLETFKFNCNETNTYFIYKLTKNRTVDIPDFLISNEIIEMKSVPSGKEHTVFTGLKRPLELV